MDIVSACMKTSTTYIDTCIKTFTSSSDSSSSDSSSSDSEDYQYVLPYPLSDLKKKILTKSYYDRVLKQETSSKNKLVRSKTSNINMSCYSGLRKEYSMLMASDKQNNPVNTNKTLTIPGFLVFEA